jgi:DNA-binding NtrC family response regulator
MTGRTVRILVVDDDPGLLAVLECGLSQQPELAVTAIQDARKAMEAVAAGGWDLLVTDYALSDPGINGVDLLRASRELPHPPLVIVITAFASLQITLESINLGAHNFLTKPFQMDELYLVVRNAVAAVRLERENAALRDRAEQLAAGLSAIERQHAELVERLRRLEYEGGGEAAEEIPAAALNTASTVELRRRRMRDQIAAYLRAGEDIGLQLREQRDRLERVVDRP